VTRLILVKHAMPLIDESRPPREWPISPEGLAASERLADKLAGLRIGSVAASSEPKANDTGAAIAARLAVPMVTDSGLIEHHREAVPFLPRDEFNAIIGRLFDEPDRLIYGEETADQAHARFSAALDRQIAAAPAGALLVASHGTVISLWVSRRLRIAPLPLWKALTLPSAVVLSEDGRSVELIEA
jgi:broad specificity phosphatase PhoE